MIRLNKECQCEIGFLRKTFKKVDNDCDVIVRSACCSKALVNENTGIYGCELLEAECPYGEPDPRRCLSSRRFPSIGKQTIFIPMRTHKTIRQNQV
jgi:hypothetical protein